MNADDEQKAIQEVVFRLGVDYPRIAEDLVQMTVDSVAGTFRTARIRDFVPLLVEREARDRLQNLPE